MKLARIGERGSEVPAVLDRDGVHRDVSSLVSDFTPEFFAGDGTERLRSSDLSALPAVEGRIGAPIARPSLILCVGLNYVDHANESSMKVPEEPILFTKAPNCLVGPYDEVLTPRGATTVDYEVELAVVIGRQCRYLESPEQAMEHLAGFTIANDVSERTFQLQRGGGQWIKGKSCETFNPCGPYLATTDEVNLDGGLDLWLDVNGERRQTGSTHDMIFDIATVIHHVSQFMVLEPGDLVNTGTPPGVAMGMAEPGYLSPGDVMTLGITGLGEQRQEVASA
ncbi:MAG: fumarylacetoacetate hydrolase family protein [Candidatus Nanopelagicales bacterium]|nr:fumarylacetoacetate hydrolase family protein [Ilumatobacteraceae bacterium]MBL6835536.1 fumarylacetoacetate hydrolase family protein [Candidatus Nanopelagicales bacterium]